MHLPKTNYLTKAERWVIDTKFYGFLSQFLTFLWDPASFFLQRYFI